MHPIDLETLVSRELARLPALRAPHTLLPRVLATVQAWSRRPWYAREWFTWPVVWQLTSIAALIVIVGGGVVALPIAKAAVQNTTSALLPTVMTALPEAARTLDVTTNTTRVLWRAVIEPLLPYAFVFVGLMCLACGMVALALNRAIFGRPLHS
jgi:hypothetical protein